MIERAIKYVIPLSVLLLPACSQEDEPGAEPRPMEFSISVADQLQSRVSETSEGKSLVWSDGDTFKINVEQGGKSSSADCVVGADGKIKSMTPQLFWNNSGEASITAYYSNIEGQATNSDDFVEFADQSGKLAYVLKASATAKNGSTVNLVFSHQLAKVRVVVKGDKADDVKSVSVYNYKSCSVDDTGAVTEDEPGYIKMCKNENVIENGTVFEANVVPTAEIPDNFISFGEDFDVAVSGIESLLAGNIYTITINATSGESSSVETTIGGHPAVLMRDGDDPLYVATMNIGATNPKEFGKYFWWGDVTGKHREDESFRFYDDNTAIKSYNMNIDALSNAEIIEGEESEFFLGFRYDAAWWDWDNGWYMPSQKDFQWLLDYCDWEYVDGTNDYYEYETYGYYIIPSGYKVTSKSTHGEIFLPFGGRKNMTSIEGSINVYNMVMNTRGYYWSCTPCVSETDSYVLFMTNTTDEPDKTELISQKRYYGCFIRPISYGPKQ